MVCFFVFPLGTQGKKTGLKAKNHSLDNFSGLPRRSCLTARNDVKHTPTLRRAMPHANDLRLSAFRLTFHVFARHEAIQKII